MSETLDALFGSKARARLLRFFLLNSEEEHVAAEISRKNMLNPALVRRELNMLKRIKFVVEKTKKRKKCYKLNPNFPFHSELRDLVVKSNVCPQSKTLRKVRTIGDVKLAMVGGVFLNDSKSNVDMVIVANNVSNAKLNRFMNGLEAEMGKEIRYSLLNKDEFVYRMDMLDRFLLDFFEGPKNEVVNKMPEMRRKIGI